MPWVLAAFLFWLALRGKLAAYAGFATKANPSPEGFLSAVFGSISIPFRLWTGTSSSSTAPTAASPQGRPGVSGVPGGLGTSTPAPGTAASSGPSWANVQQTFAKLGIGTAESQRIAGLNQEARGNVAGGAAGL